MSTTRYGVQANKLQSIPSQLIEQGDLRGRVKVLYDKYTLSGALSTNDIINMGGLLPEGARVIGAKLVFTDLDSSTNALLDVGWAVSPTQDGGESEAVNATGFMASVNAQSAGVYDMFTSNSTAAGYQKVFAAPVQPQILVHTAGDATTGSIQLEISYVVD